MTPPNEIYRLVKKQYMNTHRHSISRICATVRVHTWNTEEKKKKRQPFQQWLSWDIHGLDHI